MTPEQLATVLQQIRDLETALDFLVGIEPAQRQKLVKPGDGGQGFINRAYKLGLQIQDHLPRSFDLDEMRKDMDMADSLMHIMIATSQLAEKLADTHAVANSEAYLAALLVYRTAKHVRGVKGLEQALDELGRRFARVNSPATEPPVPVEDKAE